MEFTALRETEALFHEHASATCALHRPPTTEANLEICPLRNLHLSTPPMAPLDDARMTFHSSFCTHWRTSQVVIRARALARHCKPIFVETRPGLQRRS